MASIETWKQYLLTVYPVRKTQQQKAEFRRWLAGELKRAGWRAREEGCGRTNGSVNLVAGDPEKATVFLCTHYDTPSRMLVPDFVSPTNVAAHVLYHLAAALLLAAGAFLASLAVSFPLGQPGLMLPLFLILMVALLWAAAFGPANRHNANGSSSGVLALLAAADALRHDNRVCLVFLDNNSRNLLGASGFLKAHPAARERLMVNLDCVGDGEHLLLIPSRYSRWDGELLKSLEESFSPREGVEPRLLSQGLSYYPSDHRRFKFHVAVCACHRLTGLGYYIPHLRTGRDTTLREANIRYLAASLADFVPRYLDTPRQETEEQEQN